MGFFQWAILGIGIAVIVLLYVIVDYVKQSLSYLELIRGNTAGCYHILKDINDEGARKYLNERNKPND